MKIYFNIILPSKHFSRVTLELHKETHTAVSDKRSWKQSNSIENLNDSTIFRNIFPNQIPWKSVWRCSDFYMSTDRRIKLHSALHRNANSSECVKGNKQIDSAFITCNFIYWFRYIDYINDCKQMAHRKHWREHNFSEKNISIKNRKYEDYEQNVALRVARCWSELYFYVCEIAQMRENHRFPSNSNTLAQQGLEESVVVS